MGLSWKKCRYNKEIGENWFANRLVDNWNRRSYEVVSAESIASFKRRLDKVIPDEVSFEG